MEKKLWSTGVVLKWRTDVWFAECEFESFTIGDTDSDVYGRLGAKYGDADPVVPVQIVIELAKQAGVSLEGIGIHDAKPRLYVERDGEGVEMPDGWHKIIAETADKIGFISPYGLE